MPWLVFILLMIIAFVFHVIRGIFKLIEDMVDAFFDLLGAIFPYVAAGIGIFIVVCILCAIYEHFQEDKDENNDDNSSEVKENKNTDDHKYIDVDFEEVHDEGSEKTRDVAKRGRHIAKIKANNNSDYDPYQALKVKEKRK